MSFYSMSLGAHVGAGAVALVTFWTAVLARKGSRPHVLAGRVYLLAMAVVIVSGGPLVAALLERGQLVAGVFLGFLLLLVANACWSAWRAIRDRRHPERYTGPIFRLLNALVLLSGAGVVFLGVSRGAALLVVFGAVGVLAGGTGLRRARSGFSEPNWWVREHYGAMLGNGVATHIAFLAVGLRSLAPGLDGAVLQYIAWFGPLSAAIAAGWWLDRRYGRRATPASRRA